MKFDYFVIYFTYVCITLLFLLNNIHCKKKDKQRPSEVGYRNVTRNVRSGRGEDTDDYYESVYDSTQPPSRRQPPGRARGPPGGQPPGQVRSILSERDQAIIVTSEQRTNYDSSNNNNDNKNNSNKKKSKKKSNKNNNNNSNNDQDTRPARSPATIRPPLLDSPSVTEVRVPASEWRQLERLQQNWANTAHQKSALSRKFIFYLERDTSYQRHDACLTPEKVLGHCHYIQHCPIPDVIRNFDKFLSYACFIRNRFVGICCPDDYLGMDDYPVPPRLLVTAESTTRQPLRQVYTTERPNTNRPQTNSNNNNRPQTNRPRPSSDNGSDGSDYYNDNNVCGLSENVRIIGGALADPKDWIWMAALLLKSETKPYCGGAVITSQHILTAAHCLNGLTPDKITVRLGAYDFSQSADPEAQDFSVDYFKIHAKYNRQTHENDLAIVKLSRKTRFTDALKPICLPQRNRNYAGQLAIVTGWGHTNFGGSGSQKLKQVSIPVWNNTACDASYSVAIADQMLCAGNRQGGKDSCQGDSGGPLMLQGPNKRWMIIGVVSWGVKCGQPNYPGVYTRISKYIDWIKTNSNDVNKK